MNQNQTVSEVRDVDSLAARLDELERKFAKAQFQIQLLTNTIDDLQYPLISHVLQKDWDEKDIRDAHDIFQDFHEQLEQGESPDWNEFECRLRERFGGDQHDLKYLVLAFYRDGLWLNVCERFARAFEHLNFVEIDT